MDSATLVTSLQSENTSLQEKLSVSDKEIQTQKSIISSLQEKREASLREIQKLTIEIQAIKASISTPKTRNNSEIFEGFPNKNNFNNNSSINNNNNLMNINNIPHNNANLQTNNGPNPLQKSLIINSPLVKKQEAKFLSLTKKELEIVYREMLEKLLPLAQDGEICKVFVKIEKKLNDAIRRAQDHIDTLQDM